MKAIVKAGTIDQAIRRLLLRRIARGERQAVGELVALYEQAGYPDSAASYRKALESPYAWDVLWHYAKSLE